jgi:deazaflavin-dependent oxidoreductase (nitroreductase family)
MERRRPAVIDSGERIAVRGPTRRKAEPVSFSPAVIESARNEREIELTTYGRKSGQPSRRILWIGSDGERVFVRSGRGLDRDWPQNVLANGRAMLHIAGQDIPVQVRHVTDQQLARQVTDIYVQKYDSTPQRPPDGGPTLAEQATFELTPA